MLPPDQKAYMDYAINKTHQHIKQKFPWIKRETANPYMERHKDDFDIWTPVTSQITDKSIDNYRKAQADGQEAWAYVCCGPGRPYANFFIDMDGVCPRVLPWQFFQYKLTGFLYYLINHYQPTKNWNMAAPKWPDEGRAQMAGRTVELLLLQYQLRRHSHLSGPGRHAARLHAS